MKKYCLALDLADDPELIAEYEKHHQPEKERPAITRSIKDAGITNMELYRTGNRLVMLIEANDDFDFSKKAKMDAENPAVLEWENFVWKFQRALPWAKPGEKWVLMEKIYELPV